MWLMGIGLISWGLGNVMWFYYDTCHRWPWVLDCGAKPADPYPSYADVFYLGLLPFALAGLFQLSRVLALRPRDFLIGIVFLAAAFVTTGYWGLKPVTTLHILGNSYTYGHGYMVYAGASTTELLVGYGYIVTDAVLVALALVLLVHARRLAGGMFLGPILAFVGSFVALYIADFVFVWRDSVGIYELNGDVTEVGYSAFMVLGTVGLYLFDRVERTMRSSLDVSDVETDVSRPVDAPSG
jgi:hypothetical protein